MGANRRDAFMALLSGLSFSNIIGPKTSYRMTLLL